MVNRKSTSMPLIKEMQEKAVSNSYLHAEVDHRVANNLAVLSSSIRLQAKSIALARMLLTAGEASTLLQEVSVRLEVVSKLHKLLGGALAGDRIDVGEFLGEICATLRTLGDGERIKIHLLSNCTQMVVQEKALSIGLIAAELITNSIKYAHPTGLPVDIEIVCQKQSRGSFFVEVRDDGVGLPEGFDATVDGGLGFKLIRSLADQVGAVMSFSHDGLGLRSRLVMPVDSDD
jgi:two-component sensor histidine kinase